MWLCGWVNDHLAIFTFSQNKNMVYVLYKQHCVCAVCVCVCLHLCVYVCLHALARVRACVCVHVDKDYR